MAKNHRTHRSKNNGKARLWTAALITLAVLAGLGLWLWRSNRNASQPPAAISQSSSGITSQNQTGDNSGKSSVSQNSSSVAQGGAVDNKGESVASTPSSKWTAASSGNITLHSPTSGTKVKSGDLVSGTAKVSVVQYRLVDNQAGVLAMGQLSVVNGKFSGSLQFRPYSSAGRLDVFSYNAGGAEINSLEVNVKF